MSRNDQLHVPAVLSLAEDPPPQLLHKVECEKVYVERLWKWIETGRNTIGLCIYVIYARGIRL
jgi:hypothetical protein